MNENNMINKQPNPDQTGQSPEQQGKSLQPQALQPNGFQYGNPQYVYGRPNQYGNQITNTSVPYVFARTDIILALAVFVLAYMGVQWFGLFANRRTFGLGVTIYTSLYGLTVILYALSRKTKIGMGSIFWLIIMLLCSLSFFICYNTSLIGFQTIFLKLVTLYFTVDIFGALITGKTSGFVLLDGINMLIIIPFMNYLAQWKAILRKSNRKSINGTVFRAILGLLCGIPVIVLTAALLSSADQNFEYILSDIMNSISDRIGTYIWTFVLSLPLGMYIYGLIYGSAHKRHTNVFEKTSLEEGKTKCSIIPSSSIYAILVVLLIMYVLFIVLQGGYYLGAVNGKLEEGFTYSEYARRGFFELVVISLINMGLIGFASVFARKKIKTIHIILALITIFIIATAMAKMYLYIRVYGLTPLRLIPTVFMIWLFIIFALIIADQIKEIPVIRYGVISFAVMFTALSLSNMDGRIAEYDIGRYINGTVDDFPNKVLKESDLAGVTAIYNAWEDTDDTEFEKELVDAADYIESKNHDSVMKDESIGGINPVKAEAVECLKEMSTNTYRDEE